MRWLRAVTVALAATVAVAACGGTSPASSSSGSKNSSFSVALMTSGPLGDKGFFDSAAAGVNRIGKDLRAKTKIVQSPRNDPNQWVQNLAALSDGTYSVVIFDGTTNHNNLEAVVKQHPQQKYIVFDDTMKDPNVESIRYKQNEGSYLAGVLAGIVTTDTGSFPLSKAGKTVGLVGGLDIPVINDFKVGFEQGAKSVDPSIKLLVSYAGTFDDPNKGYNLAKAMYDQGADIVFAVAGGTGLGVLKASQDANKYSIGVDSDQNDLNPGHVVASMVKRIDNSLVDESKRADQGKADWGQIVYYGLQNQGIGLVLDDQLVPAKVKTRLNAATQDVASGKVKVATTLNGN